MDMSTTSSDIGAGASGNNNYYHNSEMKEHMFEKSLTPSDVGKLNRLVIPKQHAENYFPLEDNQNGTVLDFQDRNGKMWRFRYSYWNSSQSYVMTKGWSRFVKEKKLFAGDTVYFQHGYIPDNNEPEKRRKLLFIDWKHKAEINLVHNINHHNFIFGSPTYPTGASYYPVTTEYPMPSYRSFPPFYPHQFQEREYLGYGYGRLVNGGRYYSGSPLDHHHHHHQWNLGRSEPLVYESVPVFPAARVRPSAPSHPPEGTSSVKKLRLFGVDVEESCSSGETRGEMGVAGYSSSSPVVIRDDDQSSWMRSPRGEMGTLSSSVMQLSDDEEYKRKGKSLEF